jgi:hypothetical protein
MIITPHTIREALALPPGDDPVRRLPKDILAEHGAAHAADRKLIDKVIERLDWWATLSPSTIGVAAAIDDEQPVPAIQLLALTARAEPTQRLLTIIHRAIPVPILLLTALPGGAGTRVSFAPLRRAERIEDKMVAERLIVAPDCIDTAEPVTAAFIASLAVPALPRFNLGLLYDGLIERAEALEIARLTGQPFRLADDPASRREALALYRDAEVEWLTARAAAKREKVLARQVALGEQVRHLRRKADELIAQLGE